ncbi:hypothetical protein PENTCL1PPCAC_26757, partial [Pristionchus entomophagus]
SHTAQREFANLQGLLDLPPSRGNLASTVIPVLSILIERMNSEHSCASVRAAIRKRLVDTLEVYKQNEFLVLATCLDPRFKINFLDATSKELLHAKVLEILDESTEDTNEKPVEEEEDDPFHRPVQGDEPASV